MNRRGLLPGAATVAGFLPVVLLEAFTCSTGPVPAASPAASRSRIYFSDGFENAARIEDLFPRDLSRWHGLQREPATNAVTLSGERVHGGRAALKLQAGPSRGESSKADVVREGLTFRKGDHVWSSVWYYLESGRSAEHPLFLWDLEATRTGTSSPGRRIYLTGSDWVTSDLGKWFSKEVFRQPYARALSFPKDRWVRLTVHLFLSEGRDGRMEVWQDAAKTIDATGKTLPTAASVYDRLQVGITANADDKNGQTLWVDDVTISSEPLP